MWRDYLQPTSLTETLRLLREHAGRARIVAGGTDVLVELSRGVRPTETLIDITALRELQYVREVGGVIQLGALTTHNDVIASRACVARGAAAGAGLLGGRRAADSHARHRRRQPRHRLAGQRHDHAAAWRSTPRSSWRASRGERVVPLR